MALLYDRTEQDGVVEIVFKRQLMAYPVILVLYIISMFVLRQPLVGLAVILIGLFVVMRDRRAIAPEIRKAAEEDRLTVSGSQWSRRNPLTYTIGAPKAVRKGRKRGKGKRR
jgi:hypothetical protein